jgi:hypothetical protein
MARGECANWLLFSRAPSASCGSSSLKVLLRMKILVLFLGLAFVGCATSSARRTTKEPIVLRSVTVSPRALEKTGMLGLGVHRPASEVAVGAVARREFVVALRRGRYFPEVTGAVPETPRSTDFDVRSREDVYRSPRAEGVFHVTVTDWGIGSELGSGGRAEPSISLSVVLTDRHGVELARASANSHFAAVPRRALADYLGDPEVVARDVGVAAQVASERLLKAMFPPPTARR